ncbi:MAG: hypothetical protein P4L55_10680 [Syntrophobacteraceae bacterium]|nr:hypothetical protein [Syntrophobacteraceae bacterium]
MELCESDLCGWELNNPDPDLFELQVVEIVGSCVECLYCGECGMPCESVRRLAPKEGRIVGLGQEKEGANPKLSYFALLVGDEVRFIRLCSPESYWATASCISREHVPTWALLQLNEGMSLPPEIEKFPLGLKPLLQSVSKPVWGCVEK